MRKIRWLGLGVVVLAACSLPVQGTAPLQLQGEAARLAQTWGDKLPMVIERVSSELYWNNIRFVAGRAIDKNTDLEWASSDSDYDPSLTVRFDARHYFERIRIKTGPSLGTTYRVEVSDDGSSWRDASGPLSNSAWDMEEKAVSGAGRYMRIHFSEPQPPRVRHFSIFELEVFSDVNETALVWNGLADAVSYFALGADGVLDGSFRLRFELPRVTEILAIDLYGLDGSGNRTGYHWSSRNSGYWLLGVDSDIDILRGHRTTLGSFPAGWNNFLLYGSEPSSFFQNANRVEAEVTFGDTTTRRFRAGIPD